MRCATLVLLVIFGCSPAPRAAPPEPTAAPSTSASATPKAPENAYGWYEAMDSPEVLAWVKQRNDAARHTLDALPSRPEFKTGLAKYIEEVELGVPVKTKSHYLYIKKVPGQNQPILVRTKHIGKDEETVLDPNTWSSDGSAVLSGWSLSRDEKRLAYGVSSGGSDWRSWKIIELSSLKPLSDELRGLKWSAPTWAPRDVGLFYSGYPDRSHSESAKGTGNRIYYHALGSAQADDPEAFVPSDEKWMVSVDVYEDEDLAELYLYKSSDSHGRIQLYPVSAGWEKDPKALFADDKAHVLSPDFAWGQWVFGSEKGVAYLFSDHDAPLGRIDRFSVADDKLETIVPPRAETLVDVNQVGAYLFAKYVADVKSFVIVYDRDGKQVDEIRMPYPADIFGFGGGRSWHNEAFFGAAGYSTPYSLYRYRLPTKKQERVWSLDVDFDADEYETKQVFYSSKDGTRVPMFVLHRKDLKLDGHNPTLLQGYGCYGVVSAIRFVASRIPWLEKGGVLAVANIRGGGEYGEAWHRAGQRENKQNSIDDFIAAAQWLEAEKYASPAYLTINGASCGGLLVGAAATQRPELFAAAIPEVGIFDLLRYHEFSGAYLWEDELGSPDKPDERFYLEKLSPLVAAQRDRVYPAMLITTRKKDTRVAPMNAYKFAAALLDHQAGTAPILLRVDEVGGHGLGTLPIPLQIEYLADLYAFAWDNSGKQP